MLPSQKNELRKLEDDIPQPREDHPLLQVVATEDAGAGTPGASHSTPSVSSSPGVLAAHLPSQDEEGDTSRQEAGGPATSREPAEAQAPPQPALLPQLGRLVEFLLLKYRAREPVGWAEMLLQEVLGNDPERLPGIFKEACECLQLVFGIDVKEAEPGGDSYVLSTTLGLSYDGLLTPEQLAPKTGLLVIVLSVILLHGDVATEESVWRALELMGVYVGREHFIFGEPWELLTQVWVRERYLEYRPVPGSHPARYEFLWGPRAHAETSQEDVLEHIYRVIKKEAADLGTSEEAVCGEEAGL